MLLSSQLSWMGLMAVFVSCVCAMHNNAETLTPKEMETVLKSLTDDQLEAPVRWDLLQVHPPHQLLTKNLILEYVRIESNFGLPKTRSDARNEYSAQVGGIDEQQVS